MAISISLRHVSVSYHGIKALQDMSLDIPGGRIVGLLGPSGAGKTTLMRVIVGRQRLAQGAARVLGQPAGHRSLRGRIGYMTQAVSIYPDLSVQENMHYFATLLGVGKDGIRTSIDEVDLTKQWHQLAGTMSGGQKARLSLAIALLGNPELLVLDEPTVGVDPVLRRELWVIFHRAAGRGATLLVSSHVMDEATHCDELLLVRDGRLLAQGSPAELCRRTSTNEVEDAFLKLVEAEG